MAVEGRVMVEGDADESWRAGKTNLLMEEEPWSTREMQNTGTTSFVLLQCCYSVQYSGTTVPAVLGVFVVSAY
jgi:hypothetical protein